MSGFYEALSHVLKVEGGFANIPEDRGGATNYGITQGSYQSYRTSRNLPSRSVREIAQAEVEDLYHSQYWLAGKCDALPWPVSLCHFDALVNHRPKPAVILLQRALGVKEDGIMGPQTIAAAAAADRGRLVRRFVRHRFAYYRNIVMADKSQVVFIAGWIGRVLDLWDRCARDLPEAA